MSGPIKINCITLKIRSKTDFKSKSQNIWQQIILFSSTVMQMICAWDKIWTLSGRLSLMRNVQLMKKKNIYIPCVPHKNNCKKNWFRRHETDRFLNNHYQECVCAYLSIHDCLFFLHEVMIGNHRTKTFSQGYDRQSSEHNNRKLISLHNNGEDDKHAHGFADF
jgi:hypothetical protein